MKIAVIGAGSFGLALAKHFVENDQDVKLWAFSKEERENLNNNRKSKYLPEVIFPENLKASNNLEEVVKDADIIFHVTPSKFFRDVLKKYKEYIKKDAKILICSKGFEKETNKTLEEVLEEELPNISYGIFSGPSHAEEVSKNIETAIVCASKDEDLIKDVMKIVNAEKIRVYGHKDVIGVSLGGSLKNIIAVAAGICSGLNLGDNTLTAVITRGLVELSRFAEKMGADKNTIYGLSGLGDLLVTCLSEHSRNRRAGLALAEGKKKEEIQKEMGMVIEGFDNIEVVYNLSRKYNIETPITESIYEILQGDLAVEDVVKKLMLRKNKFEQDK